MKRKIKVIVFDATGILINSLKTLHRCLDESLSEELGWRIPFRVKEHYAIRGNFIEFSNIKLTIPLAYALHESKANTSRILEQKNSRRILINLCRRYPVKPGTNELVYHAFMKKFTNKAKNALNSATPMRYALSTLKKLSESGYKIACFSDGSSEYDEAWLKNWGMNKFFDINIGIEETKVKKPNPRGLRLICKRLKTKPEEMAYVGDAIVDIKTSKNFGCKSIAIPTGFSTEKALKAAKPTFFFTNLRKMSKFLIN